MSYCRKKESKRIEKIREGKRRRKKMYYIVGCLLLLWSYLNNYKAKTEQT